MKKSNIAFIVLVVLGILMLTYFAGYHNGKRDDDRLHLHLSIDKDVYLYHEAERGDLAAVKSSLGFFTVGDYNFYEAHYGSENWSQTKLEAARQIATVAATNGSMVWFTNLTPSTK
jgi:hypothetical protein